MRFLGTLGLLACLVSLPVRGEGEAVASREEMLDAPGGRPIAILLPGGAPLPTGEARDGYAQVALVGWIRVPGGAHPAGNPVPEPALPRTSEAAPPLAGTIAASLPSGEVRYGSGARVAALGPMEELDRGWNELKGDFQKESAALNARIEELKLQEKHALSSTDNMTQATQNLERARQMRKQAEMERQQLRTMYATRADELFHSHQAAVTVADAEGQFAFPTLPPGRYRLFAVFTIGEESRRWYLPVEVTPAGGIRKDLKSEDPGPDPYFGTR